jgi:hypothetical protein
MDLLLVIAVFVWMACSYGMRVIGRRRRRRVEAQSGSVVYVIAMTDNIVKIGTTKNLRSRLRALQTGTPHRLQVIASCPGGLVLEAELHREFSRQNVGGEWFNLSNDQLRVLTARMAQESQV